MNNNDFIVLRPLVSEPFSGGCIPKPVSLSVPDEPGSSIVRNVKVSALLADN